MKKIIDSKAGFSLMEIMIVMGLMGGLAWFSIKIIENLQKSMTTFEARASEVEVKNMIQGLLLEPEACNHTMFGLIGGNISSIKNRNGDEIFTVGKDVPGGHVKIHDIKAVYRNESGEHPSDEPCLVTLNVTTKRINKFTSEVTKTFAFELMVFRHDPIPTCYSLRNKTARDICSSIKDASWYDNRCLLGPKSRAVSGSGYSRP